MLALFFHLCSSGNTYIIFVQPASMSQRKYHRQIGSRHRGCLLHGQVIWDFSEELSLIEYTVRVAFSNHAKDTIADLELCNL